MALFMVKDFETSGNSLFRRNFCRGHDYTDGNAHNGLILKEVG